MNELHVSLANTERMKTCIMFEELCRTSSIFNFKLVFEHALYSLKRSNQRCSYYLATTVSETSISQCLCSHAVCSYEEKMHLINLNRNTRYSFFATISLFVNLHVLIFWGFFYTFTFYIIFSFYIFFLFYIIKSSCALYIYIYTKMV